MLRLFKNKLFILIFTTVLLFVVMGVASIRSSKLNWLSNIVSVPLAPVQKLFSSIGQTVENGMGYFKDIDAVRKENETLKARVSELENQNRELISYREKMDELRSALSLKDRFEGYMIVGGNVIAKDPGNWFNSFKIDVGMKDGIEIDYPVVSGSRGLIGRILASDATTSRVLSIIDKDSSVSGWISKPGGGPVIVRGDLTLRDQGLCIMDRIPTEVDVAVNDIVETSGLGGIYPKGITIGKVIDVRQTNSELNRYAVIEPAVDFKRLEEVYVLKTKGE